MYMHSLVVTLLQTDVQRILHSGRGSQVTSWDSKEGRDGHCERVGGVRTAEKSTHQRNEEDNRRGWQQVIIQIKYPII